MKINLFFVFKVGDEFLSSIVESNLSSEHSVANVVK